MCTIKLKALEFYEQNNFQHSAVDSVKTNTFLEQAHTNLMKSTTFSRNKLFFRELYGWQ